MPKLLKTLFTKSKSDPEMHYNKRLNLAIMTVNQAPIETDRELFLEALSASSEFDVLLADILKSGKLAFTSQSKPCDCA